MDYADFRLACTEVMSLPPFPPKCLRRNFFTFGIWTEGTPRACMGRCEGERANLGSVALIHDRCAFSTCVACRVSIARRVAKPPRTAARTSPVSLPLSARLDDAQDLLVAVQERLLAFLRADIPEIHFLPAVVRKQDGVADLDACEVSRGDRVRTGERYDSASRSWMMEGFGRRRDFDAQIARARTHGNEIAVRSLAPARPDRDHLRLVDLS